MMQHIFEVFERLRSTRSMNEKQQILKEYFYNDTLKEVLEYTYNPYKRYFVAEKSLKDIKSKENAKIPSWENMLVLLDALYQREVTGNTALELINDFCCKLTKEQVDLFKMILSKDLKLGISTTTINKIWKNLIPTFDIQLASGENDIDKIDFPAIIEPKLDGMRVVVYYDGNEVTYFSRGGKEITTLSYIDKQIKELIPDGGVFDCEVMSGDFNATISEVHRKEAKSKNSVLIVFDYLTLEEWQAQKTKKSQRQRRDLLEKIFEKKYLDKNQKKYVNIKLVDCYIVHSLEQAVERYRRFKDDGYEGAILKNLVSPYEFKRSRNWVKMKPSETIDLEVLDIVEGTGKYQNCVGALTCELDGVKISIGGGIKDEERKEWWEHPEKIVGSIIEIEYMEKTKNKNGTSALRHPRFIRIRSFKGEKY